MRLYEKLKYMYLYCKEYSCSCYFSTMPYNLYICIKGNGSIEKKLLERKHKYILKYLYNHYYSKIEIDEKTYFTKEKRYDNCIWTAWLQGEENAPEVIKMNLASMRKYSNSHRLIVLTNDNIFQYIDIPHQIREKYNRGIIGNAHFSDVVRMMVLAQYGGVWLDATMFLHEPIDEVAFSSLFYSIGVNKQYSRYISDNKWKVCVLGGSYSSHYLKQISSILNAFWIDHVVAIDYFVFDYIIALLYRNDSMFRQIVDNLPRTNINSNELVKIINDDLDVNKLNDLFIENQIYYLSYRNTYVKLGHSGEETNYGYLYNCLFKKH